MALLYFSFSLNRSLLFLSLLSAVFPACPFSFLLFSLKNPFEAQYVEQFFFIHNLKFCFFCFLPFQAKCMYLFGGVKGFAGGVHNNDRERTRIIQKIWLAIPSLAELCWQHVLDLCPDMAKLSKEDLIGLGIPRVFTDRLKPVR